VSDCSTVCLCLNNSLTHSEMYNGLSLERWLRADLLRTYTFAIAEAMLPIVSQSGTDAPPR